MMLSNEVSCSVFDIAFGFKVPRLSAAMTTPSLNLTPSTDVPVTAGDCVCVVGMACEYDASRGL
jgi:hypothetical protein